MKFLLLFSLLISRSLAFQVAPTRRSLFLLQSTVDDTPSDVDSGSATKDPVVEETRSRLKRDLLSLGASYDRGFGASSSARGRAEDLIRELEGLNEQVDASKGIDGSELSPLEGCWRMIWTTASDVLVLGASPVATPGAIYQIFEPPLVTNVIDFIPRVQALLPPNVVPSTLIRANVQTKASFRTGYPNRVGLYFESVKLQPVQVLGQDATSLPPFAANLPKLPGTETDSGPGYFDVTFLDDELLIIRQNAPGGLFALVKVPDAEP